MRYVFRSFFVLSLAAVFGLGGCATLNKTDAAYSKDNHHITRQLHSAPKPASVVEATPARYLAGRQIRAHSELPSFFQEKYVLGVYQGESLESLASSISQLAGVPVSVTSTTRGVLREKTIRGLQLSQEMQSVGSSGAAGPDGGNISVQSGNSGNIKVNYSGSLKGMLDYVAARSGVYWRYDSGSNSIRFFLTETRVFSLYALSSDSSVDVRVSNATQGGSESGNAAGQTGTTSQSVDTTSKVNIYKSTVADIHTILQQLSSSGQSVSIPTAVSANPGTGTISVTATPPVLRQVAAYIKKINAGLLKQVFINVHVYEVNLDREDNYGLNLALAFQTANLSFSPNFTSPSTPGVVGTSTATPGSLGIDVLSGRYANSKAIFSALSTQGKTGLVTSASVLALNGEPVPLQVGNQIGYLASSTVSQSANVGTTAALQQGTITTGFSANFMPRILPDGRVLLQYSMNLSSLLNLTTVKSGGSEIQTPDVSTRAFLQRAVLRSGQTLVLAGFERKDNQNSRDGIGSPSNWALGGGYAADHSRTAIVVSIHVQTL